MVVRFRVIGRMARERPAELTSARSSRVAHLQPSPRPDSAQGQFFSFPEFQNNFGISLLQISPPFSLKSTRSPYLVE
jgi:hypothetical protein